MKKIIAFILTLIMALSLCACSEIPTIEVPETTQTPAAETPAPTPTPEPTPEPTPAPEDPQQIIVNISTSTENQYAPDNEEQMILEFSYETVSVFCESNPEMAAKINDCLSVMEEQFYTGNDYGDGYSTGFNGYYEMALDNYSYAKENNLDINLTFGVERSARVQYIGDNAMSIIFNEYTYTGGAHGNYGDEAIIFDTATGDVLTLDSISADRDALTAALTEKIIEKAHSEEYAEQIAQTDNLDEALALTVIDGRWYFDANGITVFSNPYEVAPYAAGIISFDIPYSELEGLIDERFMPVEREISAELTANTETDSPNIADRVVDNVDGHDVMLTISGAACNIKISKVRYYDLENSGAFYETGTLWYCGFLRDSAIQLVTVLPEGMPDTMISFTDSQGEHRYFVSQSGQDGSIILVDDTVQSVG